MWSWIDCGNGSATLEEFKFGGIGGERLEQ